jgi:hypothetical protein
MLQSLPPQPSDLRSLKAPSLSGHRATQDASLPPQGGELATVTPTWVAVRAFLALTVQSNRVQRRYSTDIH